MIDADGFEVIDLARAQGVSWLKVWTEHLWRDDHCDLLKRLRPSDLSLSVHGPIGDLNITSSNRGIREESIRQVLQGIEEAAEMGVKVITIHRCSSEAAAKAVKEVLPLIQRHFRNAIACGDTDFDRCDVFNAAIVAEAYFAMGGDSIRTARLWRRRLARRAESPLFHAPIARSKWIAQIALPSEVVRWEWKRLRRHFVYIAAKVLKTERRLAIRNPEVPKKKGRNPTCCAPLG